MRVCEKIAARLFDKRKIYPEQFIEGTAGKYANSIDAIQFVES